MANETYYDEEKYAVNYDDSRFTDVKDAEEAALAENEQLFAERENTVANLYNQQAEQAKQWGEQQAQLQQERTDFTIEQIEQQKEQAHKDYLKEQSGAYVDWRKQSNEYGTEAEKMASSGLTNTGYSESSQVSMYNQYQNRIATARESYNQAVLNYNNAIKDAQLQNNSVLAEIAATAMEKSLELTIQGAIYKDNLLQQKADRELQLKQFYSNEYQKVLDQVNLENNRLFEADQAEINRNWQTAENEAQRTWQSAEAQLERDHDEKILSIQQEFEAKQAELERNHDKEMLDAQTKAEKELLDKKHAQELEQLKKQQEYALAQADKELANEKALLKYKYDLENSSKTTTITGGSSTDYRKTGSYSKTGGSAAPTKTSTKITGSSTTSVLPKATAQSILNLGGPYSASYVASQVANGTVKETKDKNGNTVFVKNTQAVKLPTSYLYRK